MADLRKEIWIDNEVEIGKSIPTKRKAAPLEAYKLLHEQLLAVRAKNNDEETPEEEALTEELAELWYDLSEAEQEEVRKL
jgi:hypothetical protein